MGSGSSSSRSLHTCYFYAKLHIFFGILQVFFAMLKVFCHTSIVLLNTPFFSLPYSKFASSLKAHYLYPILQVSMPNPKVFYDILQVSIARCQVSFSVLLALNFYATLQVFFAILCLFSMPNTTFSLACSMLNTKIFFTILEGLDAKLPS